MGNKQQMNYAYNIRGWLTRINNPSDNFTTDKLFAMDLYYDNVSTITNLDKQAQFNGNISGIRWRNNSTTRSAYAYKYDGLSRLKKGDYGEIASASAVTNTGKYDLAFVTYDKNGNIKTLQRNNSSGGMKDNLTYDYTGTGNKLSKLNGTFNGAAISNKTFSYDANGNTTVDNLRGITGIGYFKELNLPKSYTNGSTTIQYTYDAAGQKWEKKNGSSVVQKYYGDFLYSSATALDRVFTSEGYVQNGKYHFYLKDHLGNTRMVVSYERNGGSQTVEQTMEYYPFGSYFTANNVTKNKYLYNGKELNQEFFENYDYGARFYDAQLGRFHTQDRFSEKYYSMSPYHYAGNNPIKFIDINGDSLTLAAGNKADLQSSINIANASMGGFYDTSVDNNGLVSITATGKQGTITTEQQAFYDEFSSIVNGSGMTTVNVVYGDQNTLIGDITTATIDAGDMDIIGSGRYVNEAGAFIHEVHEQYQV